MSDQVYDFFKSPGAKVFLSIPHAGEAIPESFVNYLTAQSSDRDLDLDFRVHELVDIPKLQQAAVSVLRARIHRVCVDLNRARKAAVLNWSHNTKGAPLLRETPSAETREEWAMTYYDPYYQKMREELSEGVAFIDLHSMPSRPTSYHLQKTPLQDKNRPDFCVSNLNGQSSSLARIQFITQELEAAGYHVLKNDPYIGGNLTQTAASWGVQAIQIETKRSLYMDEKTQSLKKTACEKLKEILTRIFIRYAELF